VLNGPLEHNALLAVSVVTCVLGAAGLTAGMFMHYGCEDCAYMTCILSCGGSFFLFVGMLVGNYTKWRSRR
jgi:hypothetical protein